MDNEDRLREMSDDAAFYGRRATDDDGYTGEIDKEHSYALTHWDEVLAANGMTQEDYDRQADEIVQMQRDYWRDLQIYRQTGEWPL